MYIFLFFFGSMIGSFLNVVILRMPDGKSIVTPRSSCNGCGKKIAWFENIPIFSFILLRGTCSSCNAKISWQYPLIELITGLGGIIFLTHIYQGYEQLVQGVLFFTLFCIFLVHFIIDLRHFLLLDSINLYLAAILGFYGIFYLSLIHMLLGAIVGGGLPYLVTWLFYKLRGKIGLGGGDIKLWAVLGIYLGPIGIIHNIWLSCSLGAIIGIFLILAKIIDKNQPVPFGPFIIVVASIQIFFGEQFSNFLSFLL